MGRGNKGNSGAEDDTSSDVETLKTEVFKSIALALERKAETRTGVPDFDVKLGLNFYEEVTNFEITLIKQALMFTNGNQRAAARLLRLKTTTLNSKVKMYRLDLAANNE
jgi:DNA-binding NtrC family response regulator